MHVAALILLLVLSPVRPIHCQIGDLGDDLPCYHYGDQGMKKNKNCCVQKGDTCVSCAYGHGLVNGKCKECKDKTCAVCDGNTSTCLQYKGQVFDCAVITDENGLSRCTNCGNGYRMSYDQVQCQRCRVDNCDSCWSSLLSCDSCSLFHRRKEDGTCERCSDNNCLRCDDDKDVCTDCPADPGEGLKLPSKNPPNMDGAYGVRNGMCVKCGPGVSFCDQDSVDKYGPSCATGYFKEDNRCKKCPESCRQCVNATSCSDCAPGYYPTSTLPNVACRPCKTPNAYFCFDNGIASSCKEDYFLDTKTKTCKKRTPIQNCQSYQADKDACFSCKKGYGVDKKTGKCIACTDNCQFCSENASVCNMCNPGYGSYGDTCKKCPKNADSCSNISSLKCKKGYFTDTKKNRCVPCESKQCQSCPTSPSKCLVCGETRNKKKNKVTFFSPDYSKGTCKACPSNMQICLQGKYVCEPGYTLKKNTCVVTPDNR